MIIDAHVHLGDCRVFDLNNTEDEVIGTMDSNEVEVAVVQPFPGARDVEDVHNRIAELAKTHPGRIFGLASMNPHVDREEYVGEMKRCVEKLGFVGIKMHTIGHAVWPLSEDGMMILETAAELKVPVMMHTGIGVPSASPSMGIPCARQFPEVPIILAHAGFAVFTVDAYVAATECANIYLEPSWCGGGDIKWLISELGAGRVMLGSDMLPNQSVEIAKLSAMKLSPEEAKMYAGETAVKVFGLKVG